MPVFRFRVSEGARIRRGKLEAADEPQARALLAERGLIVLELRSDQAAAPQDGFEWDRPKLAWLCNALIVLGLVGLMLSRGRPQPAPTPTVWQVTVQIKGEVGPELVGQPVQLHFPDIPLTEHITPTERTFEVEYRWELSRLPGRVQALSEQGEALSPEVVLEGTEVLRARLTL
ncbi:MAG: hypothetical protein AB7S38_23750 [Vulcanimicrobiota bacterium]